MQNCDSILNGAFNIYEIYNALLVIDFKEEYIRYFNLSIKIKPFQSKANSGN
jgi:hypothetical protein